MENTLTSVPAQRPENIHEILTTLKRYNGLVVKDLEDYLKFQCENGFSDVNANLALLKLYELSSEAITAEREEATINILLLGLCNFYNPDFELYFHLLPVYVLLDVSSAMKLDPELVQFCDSVTKLKELYALLSLAQLQKFWGLLKKEEAFQDLVYDSYVSKTFDNSIRLLIIRLVYKGYANADTRIKLKISSTLFQNYLNLYDAEFEKYISAQPGFTLQGEWVFINSVTGLIGQNKPEETGIEARGVIVENVKLEQLSRLVRGALTV